MTVNLVLMMMTPFKEFKQHMEERQTFVREAGHDYSVGSTSIFIVIVVVVFIAVIVIVVIIVIIIVILTTRLRTGWAKLEQGAMTTIGARLFVFSRWAHIDRVDIIGIL